MSDDKDTRSVLDAAVRAHAEDMVDDGEMVTGWIVLAATRRFDGGGVVIAMVSDEALPTYEARGILAEAMATIERNQAED